MPRSDSDSEAAVEGPASAYVARANFAALRALEPTPLISEPDWHNDSTRDFQHRVAVSQYRFVGGDQDSVPRSYKKPTSTSSSMAVTEHSRSTYWSDFSNFSSTRTPSLAGSVATTKSAPSIRTSRADSFIQPAVLQEDESGALQIPAARLDCPYQFLSCNFAADDLGVWDLHCQGHFRGYLPKTVECPFTCVWKVSEVTGEEAWTQRQAHINNTHIEGESVDSDRRPSADLIHHLYVHHIVDAAQCQELRRNGRLGDNIYLQSAGSREHRRERNGPRGPPSGPLLPRYR